MDASIALIPITSIICTFTMIVLVVWFVSRAKQRAARYRADVQTKLIEKFSSAPELAEFLASPAGKEFIGNMHEPVKASAHDRIFSGIKWSMIVTFFGIGFLIPYLVGEERDLIVPAGLFLAVGIGWAIATFLTYRLSRSWGLVSDNGNAKDVRTAS